MNNYNCYNKSYENGYLEGSIQIEILNKKIEELEMKLDSNKLIIERFNKTLIYIQDKILCSEENQIECVIDGFKVLDIMLGIE